MEKVLTELASNFYYVFMLVLAFWAADTLSGIRAGIKEHNQILRDIHELNNEKKQAHGTQPNQPR